MNAELQGRYLAEFIRAMPGREIPWLARLRKEAFARFAEKGFPTTREEEWKYTSVAALEKISFATAPPAEPGEIAPFGFPGADCHQLVFINGRFAPALSRLLPLPAGVRIASLADVLEQYPERLEARLTRASGTENRPFAALNAAFVTDGGCIELAPGAVVEAPIHLLFLTASGGRAVMTHPRSLIVAGEGSRAMIVEHYAALDDGTYFTNAVTEVALGRNAQIEHLKLQEESFKAFHIAVIEAHQDAGSRYASHSVSLGALLARNDINTALDGEDANCELNGLYLADDRQHVDHHTRIDHTQPRGTSRELYKGILAGRARGVFSGKVMVHEGAQKTDARQTSRNLLLSRDAEVDTKPQLEIYADDVKCSHGATVGQLDEDMIFYLRSRGIDEAAAKGLLTHAFAAEVLNRISSEPIRHVLEARLLARLPQGERIREFYGEQAR